jgi:TRAP-type C4-dicarboxylate transport system permease small subunit
MNFFTKWYNRTLDILIGGSLLIIVSLVILQVGARYFYGGAFTWSEEGNLFLWGWMILLAAIRTDHMKVDFVVKHLPRAIRKTVIILIAVIALFLLGLLFWGGKEMVELTLYDYYIAISWLSVKWLFIALMITAVLWAAKILIDSIHAFRAESGEGA